MKVITLMLAVFLYVDQPVSTLQFDLDTPGQISLASGVDKDIATNRLANGKLRVIVYKLNLSVFQGKFANVDNNVSAISGVVGSDPNGLPVNCRVTTLSQPKNLNISVNK
jgi:hypothetical protein